MARPFLPARLAAGLFLLLVAAGSAQVDETHSVQKRQFNRGTDASFHHYDSFRSDGGSSLSFGSGVKTAHGNISPNSGVKTEGIFINGDCVGAPRIINARLSCRTGSGCRANCYREYQFPNGQTQLFLTCVDGHWQVENTEWDTIPNCEPICLPACQHNGICEAPGKCNCPEGYTGPRCQFEKRPCLNQPPRASNSRRVCIGGKTCTVTCLDNHQFPDGSSVANLICKEGDWVPAKPDWVQIPDCEPICSPPCQNGGSCLSFNLCLCPQDYRGSQCQYRSDACTPQNLNFNGQYSCQQSGNHFACTVSCPPGARFLEPPAEEYICDWATGTFSPPNIPQCIYDSLVEMIPSDIMEAKSQLFSNKTVFLGTIPHEWSLFDSDTRVPVVLFNKPLPGDCFTWSHSHFKTFDGKILSFEGDCTYTLVNDAVDNTFSVLLDKEHGYHIKIFTQGKEILIYANTEDIPVLNIGGRKLSVPAQLPGITAELFGQNIMISLTTLGVSLKWDKKNFIGLHVSEAMWNKTGGLCGRLDGSSANDLSLKDGSSTTDISSFVSSWQAELLGKESCTSQPSVVHPCTENEPIGNNVVDEASSFCSRLLTDIRFASCRTVLDAETYYETCRWDYCSCKLENRLDCACESFAMFVKECVRQGVTNVQNWRDQETCPMRCSDGMVYLPCGTAHHEMCGSVSANRSLAAQEACEEGCYCPEGMLLHQGTCVHLEQCPCQLRGRFYSPGETVPRDCNTCTCQYGRWVCTQTHCSARCASVGDPHYATFDGRRYDFMGKCSYYLVKGNDFSIETDNVACAGSVSEAMNFPATVAGEMPSCNKALTVRIDGIVEVKLLQNREVLVNGQLPDELPVNVSGIYIHEASSMFVVVKLPNGLKVWWDGVTRVYVDAPPTMREKTKGLCGTFNSNQKDDFLTPEGDIEQSVTAFANKWKTQGECGDEPDRTSSHPCDANVQNKETAIRVCSKLHSTIFADCHYNVDPQPFYEDCLYDVCSCQLEMNQCFCPILAAYAKECSRNHVPIDWRPSVRECGVRCPLGQQYRICGNPCIRTCSDLTQQHVDCGPRDCVEGCNCPDGEALGPGGACIPTEQCPCLNGAIEVLAGSSEVKKNAHGGYDYCVCSGAKWTCRVATPDEQDEYGNITASLKMCHADMGEEYSFCPLKEARTCKNMHIPVRARKAGRCIPQCTCKKGLVRNTETGRCIPSSECPCHHAGQSFPDGGIIQNDCNQCTCTSGKWNCTQHICDGLCTAWGDSHYKTFDGRLYDFQGSCDYVLAKGSINDDSFIISVQNVPCSSLGATCSKSVNMLVNFASKKESVTFIRGSSMPDISTLKRIQVREAGLFIFSEVPDLDILLQWDRGTRVYVKLGPRWKGLVKGLCGNFNNNEVDDFQTPSGGISEVSPVLFGDSWKLQPYCPETFAIMDACKKHTEREVWAIQKCSVLKSEVFLRCHSEVPFEPYLHRCIFDSCACDQGGDCDCLCTALATYAHECNIHGVPIKWRTQQLCPLQCDERCSEYRPCISTCPKKTCDNILKYETITRMCSKDHCIEGCETKPCAQNEVYSNLTALNCVTIDKCKPPFCLQEGHVTYYEGDLMEQDACHRCFCSHNQKKCMGEPCATTEPVPPAATVITESTSRVPNTQPECKTGWSSWLNTMVPSENKSFDLETIPDFISESKNRDDGSCSRNNMTGIECQAVGSGLDHSDTGDKVTCDLKHGLNCEGGCRDYEIRLYCHCGDEKQCSLDQPLAPSPSHCDEFLKCEESPEGVHRIVQYKCEDGLWFHPGQHKCTFPTQVALVRSECHAEDMCSVERPLLSHPTDCGKYLQCDRNASGQWLLIERECGPGTLFHPVQMVCVWPQQVKAVRPECSIETPSLDTTEAAVWTPPSTTTVSRVVCEQGWSRWFNNSLTAAGDFEVVSALQDSGLLHCDSAHLADVQCRFYRGDRLVDIAESSSKAVCDSKVGLVCENKLQPYGNQCEDYAVRFFCDCGIPTVPPNTTVKLVPETSPLPHTTLVTELTTEHLPESTTTNLCPPGEVFAECAISCDNMCHSFSKLSKQLGSCTESRKCEPGCVPVKFEDGCPSGYLMRDRETCVRKEDCPCMSDRGEYIRPGEIVEEANCLKCQCLYNEYKCLTSDCGTTLIYFPSAGRTVSTPKSYDHVMDLSTAPPTTGVSGTIATFVTPPFTQAPPQCSTKRYRRLLNSLENIHLTTSESTDVTTTALLETTGAGWIASVADQDQYLQVDLGSSQQVFGVEVSGVPGTSWYITSYHVLTSTDGLSYHYTTDNSGAVEVYRGPVDDTQPMQQIFAVPVETRYIRLNPKTWHGGIGLKVEVLTCMEAVPISTPKTTPTSPTTAECVDVMGLENGLMYNEQFQASSVLNGITHVYGPSKARLNSDGAWIPGINDDHQWLQLDFITPAILTGVITQGEPKTESWVEAFKVVYSQDGETWNSVLDENHKEKNFPANFNSDSPQKNMFSRPIKAQFLRLVPAKWHNNIAIRMEALGCFSPYPTQAVMAPTEAPPECPSCPGLPTELQDESKACACFSLNSLWNGEACVNISQCPCFFGHIPYAVGKIYETEKCETCICKLNGVPDCRPNECSHCPEGLRSVLIKGLCECKCEPCPPATILCPTSGACVHASVWCDGIEDCPDDEVHCEEDEEEEEPEPEPTTVASIAEPLPVCPNPPHCPEGWSLVKQKGSTKSGYRKGASKDYRKMYKKGRYGSSKNFRYLPKTVVQRCPTYVCIPPATMPPETSSPGPCPVAPICPAPLQQVEKPSTGQCPVFTCEPPQLPNAICNLTGTSFNTFDGTAFQYRWCVHMLARDNSHEEDYWEVSINKNCTSILHCSPFLTIKHGNQYLVLRSDLSVEFDDYTYKPEQISSIGSLNKEFVVSQVGDSLYFQSNRYDFWVTWNQQSSVKIGVTGKLTGVVDGLCGFFNGNPMDDKRTPNGTEATTFENFGDSWALEDSSEECTQIACPTHIQTEAFQLCNKVQNGPLSQCAPIEKLNHFVAECLESVCNCLQSSAASPTACHCKVFEGFVNECHLQNSSIDLTGWRMQNDCPASCPPPLQHLECYRHACEPSCDTLQQSCPATQDVCFSGCFCPDGMVRRGNGCILPSECRDCVCAGFGDPQYVTFDQQNFTFNGNCSYIAAQDISPTGKHQFQVAVTNKQCVHDTGSTCTEEMKILFKEHAIEIGRNQQNRDEVLITIDGVPVNQFPMHLDWVIVEEVDKTGITLLIPSIQLEVTYFYKSFGFTIRLPSHTYGGKTEGLCGNCNKNTDDDLKMKSGKLTEDVDEFGNSWLTEEVQNESVCNIIHDKQPCETLLPDQDPCMELITAEVFGQCRQLLGLPEDFVRSCQHDICHATDIEEAACRDMEAYVRKCSHHGLCLDWRSTTRCPFVCPPGLIYQPCGPGCMKTCENYKEYNVAECPLEKIEGCFCPEGQVLHNGTCIDEVRCSPCDDAGHFDGDTWYPDVCTTCSCKGSTKECRKKECAGEKKVCPLGTRSVQLPGGDDCCPSNVCEELPCNNRTKIPICSEDQELQFTTDAQGCKTYSCVCRPCPPESSAGGTEDELEEVFEVDLEAEAETSSPMAKIKLGPGMQRIMNNSGCCPMIKIICNKTLCPPPPPCQPFHDLLELAPLKDECCPQYACEPHKDGCIYTLSLTNDVNGGDRPRTEKERETIFKKPGENWQDGPCKQCECSGSTVGSYHAECNVISCVLPPHDTDYVFEEEKEYGLCCSHYKRVACVEGNHTYKVGEQWPLLEGNPCVSASCEEDEDGVVKKSHTEKCETMCQEGWEYRPPISPNQCCGECKQKGCMFNEKLYPEAATWESANHCMKYYCLLLNGTFQIDAVLITCPEENMTDTTIAYELQDVEGQCCKRRIPVGCRHGNEVNAFNTTYPSATGNKCESITCFYDEITGQAGQKITLQECMSCTEGWQYVEPGEKSDECCGHCVQKYCLSEGQQHLEGQQWSSPDGCTSFSCVKKGDQLQIEASRPDCPRNLTCPKEFQINDGCCKKCEYKCSSREWEPRSTIGLLKESGSHGQCVNTDEVIGFVECMGSCQSYQIYDADKNDFKNLCQCCQATGYKELEVKLLCEDGHTYTKTVSVPVECICSTCGGSDIIRPDKGNTYTKTQKKTPENAFDSERHLQGLITEPAATTPQGVRDLQNGSDVQKQKNAANEFNVDEERAFDEYLRRAKTKTGGVKSPTKSLKTKSGKEMPTTFDEPFHMKEADA